MQQSRIPQHDMEQHRTETTNQHKTKPSKARQKQMSLTPAPKNKRKQHQKGHTAKRHNSTKQSRAEKCNTA